MKFWDKRNNRKNRMVELSAANTLIMEFIAENSGMSLADAVNKVLDNMLLPQDQVIYSKVMELVDDALTKGLRSDYRREIDFLIDHIGFTLNLNACEIELLTSKLSKRILQRELLEQGKYEEFFACKSVYDIGVIVQRDWEKYKHDPSIYILLGDAIKITNVDAPLTLYEVIELATISCDRPYETDKAKKPVMRRGLFD